MHDLDPHALTSAFWSQVVVTDTTRSTNADLAAAAASGAPEGTVHVARHQSGGRGRLHRSWQAAAGTGIAASMLLRPHRPVADWPWIPLLTGVAVCDTVRDLGVEAGLKWPNDVLVDGRKLAGVLVEVVGGAAVIGVGLNVAMTAEQLPVPDATSLLLEGADAVDRTEVLVLLLRQLEVRYRQWSDGADLRGDYRAACVTLGCRVRVVQVAGDRFGLAHDVDSAGRLVVDGVPVSAADVVHLRGI